jgi:hypothetical protein
MEVTCPATSRKLLEVLRIQKYERDREEEERCE